MNVAQSIGLQGAYTQQFAVGFNPLFFVPSILYSSLGVPLLSSPLLVLQLIQRIAVIAQDYLSNLSRWFGRLQTALLILRGLC